MSKRTSGLGRGLGDLLADNSPEVRSGATVIRRNESGEATVTPDVSDGVTVPNSNASAHQNVIAEQAAAMGEEPKTDGQANTPEAEVQPRIIIGGASRSENFDGLAASSAANTTPVTENPPHRSLKALFKSYK